MDQRRCGAVETTRSATWPHPADERDGRGSSRSRTSWEQAGGATLSHLSLDWLSTDVATEGAGPSAARHFHRCDVGGVKASVGSVRAPTSPSPGVPAPFRWAAAPASLFLPHAPPAHRLASFHSQWYQCEAAAYGQHTARSWTAGRSRLPRPCELSLVCFQFFRAGKGTTMGRVRGGTEQCPIRTSERERDTRAPVCMLLIFIAPSSEGNLGREATIQARGACADDCLRKE